MDHVVVTAGCFMKNEKEEKEKKRRIIHVSRPYHGRARGQGVDIYRGISSFNSGE
jgi:hypothetical protein